MEIGKYAQNADVLEAFLPTQGQDRALGTMHQVPYLTDLGTGIK